MIASEIFLWNPISAFDTGDQSYTSECRFLVEVSNGTLQKKEGLGTWKEINGMFCNYIKKKPNLNTWFVFLGHN